MKIERGWGDYLAFCAEFKNSFNTIGLRSLAFTLTKHSHLFASKLEKKIEAITIYSSRLLFFCFTRKKYQHTSIILSVL